MSRDLNGMRIAILATDGVERIELEEPRGALYGAGAASDVLSLHGGEIQARQFDLVSAGTFSVDLVAWICATRGEHHIELHATCLIDRQRMLVDGLARSAHQRGTREVASRIVEAMHCRGDLGLNKRRTRRVVHA